MTAGEGYPDAASAAALATIDRLERELKAKQATVDALMEAYQPPDFPIVARLRFDVL